MESEKRAILATTTYAKNTDNYERVRARLVLKTIFEARLHDYDIVVVDGGSPLVMFRRANLDSYPPEQVHAYQMVQLAFRYLTNINCDFLFGPVALSHRATDYFLAYKSEYGDMWDSIHIPKLHIIQDGLPWTQVTIDYQHPQEQTRAEQGNMDLFMRRVEQIRVVTQALISEVTQHGQHETTYS